MALIDDVIECAHAEDIVLTVVQDARGCDAYQLRAEGTVTVWVRPDGRFSRAVSPAGELLTLGQVASRISAAVRDREARAGRSVTRTPRVGASGVRLAGG